MNILVIGGGGREHAVIRKIKENPAVQTIWAWPGNGGIALDAVCVGKSATDLDGICDFAKNNPVDFAVVTPDDPLILGCVDRLEALGVPCFGPDKAAARIEGSKSFAKELMKKYGIPTASYEVFDDAENALAFLDGCGVPVVIKADGPALGKGVIIANTRDEARQAVRDMMEERVFGDSGTRVVIEEFLTGPEVSVLAFTDGKTIVPMVSSMDHKRALDGDAGLNTGGMGTVAPNPYYTPEIAEICMKTIFIPTIRAMRAEGCPFKGCLYFGLMITPDGPKVIEYNCRFGDPETQVVLPLLESDLLTIMQAVRNETLTPELVRFREQSACCVILASDGYPKKYATGFPIEMPETLPCGAQVFIAGAKRAADQLVTAGGRVLGVTATANDLRTAVENAYLAADTIHFENARKRSDIGARALKALR